MKKEVKKKNKSKVIVLSVLIFIVLIGLIVGGTKNFSNKRQGESEKEVLLISQENFTNCNVYLGAGESRLSQSFKVNAIKLTKAEFIATGSGNATVVLHLREDSMNGKEIVKVSKRIDEALEGWVIWGLENVSINPKKKYFFVFECPTCVHRFCIEEVPCKRSDIICFWYQNSNVYINGSHNVDSNWDMAFRLYGVK